MKTDVFKFATLYFHKYLFNLYMSGLLIVLKWAFIILIILLSAGVLFERLSRWRLERKAFKGLTFVEINGTPIHYVKKGSGNCTVVFQSGMGSSHAIWEDVQNDLAKDAVTITYDRSGLMFSGTNKTAPTNEEVSKELERLLEKTGCPKPYILVGHSMAGIYLRPFIARNRSDIKGILFAEAAHPLQKIKASAELKKTLNVPPLWFIKFVINTGIYRLMYTINPISPEIPFGHKLHIQERDFFYRSYRKTLEEVALDDTNFKDAERYASFGEIPLTVVTGKSESRFGNIKNEEIKKEYRKLIEEVQEDLLQLSSNSKQVITSNSGHLIQVHDAALLAKEIRVFLPIRSN